MLSSYLNTHLPLPCQLNSLDFIKRQAATAGAAAAEAPPPPPSPHHHRPSTSSSTATGPPSSPSKLAAEPRRLSRTLRTGPPHENSPTYSLASSGSGHSSLPGSTRHAQNEPSHHHHHHLDHPPVVYPDIPEAKHVAGEGSAYDVSLPDGGESTHSSFLRRMEEEEEEGQTIGGSRSSSSLSNGSPMPNARRPSLPRSLTTTPDLPLITSSTSTSSAQALRSKAMTRQQQQQQETQQGGDSMILPRLRSLAYKFLVFMHQLITWVIFIVQKGLEPYSERNLRVLMQVERNRFPLTNALFCLGSEASTRHCPRLWACAQNTQLSLLVLAGGGVERYLWRELKLVVCDEVNWTRALYTLRHTLWPGGKFKRSPRRKVSEKELEQLKRKAADSFKKFLPSKMCGVAPKAVLFTSCVCVCPKIDFFPHIVGDKEYDRAVVHCLDFLRNPRLTRSVLPFPPLLGN